LLKVAGVLFVLLAMLVVALVRGRVVRWMRPDLLPQLDPAEVRAGRFALVGSLVAWVAAEVALGLLLLLPPVREGQGLYLVLDVLGMLCLVCSLLLQWASWPVAAEAEKAAAGHVGSGEVGD
jgi:hypothetical protein